LWSCAILSIQPSPAWLKALLATAARAADAGRFSVQQLATVVWSMAVLRPRSHASLMSQQLQVLVMLQALAAALKAVREGDTADAAPFEALAKPLQETGKLLSSLAVPLCCNNPVCTNISRTLEVSLVSGHSTKCSGCRVARYCDRRCQTSHWKQHKPMCQALQAGVASAAQAAEAAAQL